jgi:hypothetical protein
MSGQRRNDPDEHQLWPACQLFSSDSADCQSTHRFNLMPPDNLGHEIREIAFWNAVCIFFSQNADRCRYGRFASRKIFLQCESWQTSRNFPAVSNECPEKHVGLYSCLKSRLCVSYGVPSGVQGSDRNTSASAAAATRDYRLKIDRLRLRNSRSTTDQQTEKRAHEFDFQSFV